MNKAFLILFTLFLCFSSWCGAQNCGLEASLLIPLNDEITHTINVENYLEDSLASPTQGLCEVNIHFESQLLRDLEIDIVSPDGQRVNLIGPNTNSIEFSDFTPGGQWDVRFVRCSDMAVPDFGFGAVWDHLVNDFPAGTYTGSYYPFQGCLEDFDQGPVNGEWKIEVRNFSNLNFALTPNNILDFSLVFCNDDGNPCCFADAGILNTSVNRVTCEGDESLRITSGAAPAYFGRRPDGDVYDYTYGIFEDNILVAVDSALDLRTFPAGSYQICGISYAQLDTLNLPLPDGILSITDIRDDLGGASPSFCGDITTECLNVIISEASPVTNLEEIICLGESFAVGDTTFKEVGNHQVLLQNNAGCDSLVTLDLLIQDIYLDTISHTICQGDSITVGNSVYTMSGFFVDTLTTVAAQCDSIVHLELVVIPPVVEDISAVICSGDSVVVGTEVFTTTGNHQVTLTSAANCDSIVNLDLTVLEVEADILPADTITCDQPLVTLDGTASMGNAVSTFRWLDSSGAAIGTDSLVAVGVAGAYALEVTVRQQGTTCASQDSVFVSEDLAVPIADAGLSDTLTCVQTQLTIGSPNSSQGSEFVYLWETNDGNIVAGAEQLEPTVDQAGTYELTVRDTTNGCVAGSIVTIEEEVDLPVIAAGNDLELNCRVNADSIAGIDAPMGPEFTYQWTGPGIVSDPSLLPLGVNEPGTYTLVVTNQSTGCSNADSVTVTRNTVAPLLENFTADTLNCEQTSTELSVRVTAFSDSIAYLWTGPAVVTNDSTSRPTVDSPGTYTLEVIDQINGCSATSTVEVFQDTLAPIADAGTRSSLTCAISEVPLGGVGTSSGPNLTYRWFSNEGNIVGPADLADATADAAGVYGLIVENVVNGCTDTSFVTVFSDDQSPFVDAGGDVSLDCSSTILRLDGSNSDTADSLVYKWEGPCLETSADSIVVDVSCEGLYTLRIENRNNNCFAVDTVKVTEGPNDHINVLEDTVTIS